MYRLEELRKEKNLKQADLGRMLGLTAQAISKYEQGDREPTFEVLKKLSMFFNVSIDYLLENDVRGLTVYSEEQNQAINMLVQLNELNLSRASSYIAGLLVGQN